MATLQSPWIDALRQTAWIDTLRPRRRPIYANVSRQLTGIRYWWAIAILATGYYALILLSLSFRQQSSAPMAIWPPGAYGELVLLLLGLRFWPAIALGSSPYLFGSLFLSASPSIHPLAALIFMLNNTLQSAFAAWILLRWRFSPRFDHLRDVGLLLVGAAIIPATLSASIGVPTLMWGTTIPLGTSPGLTWLHWWIGNVNGVFVMFPIVLTCPRFCKRMTLLNQHHWGICWLGGLLFLSWFVFASPNRDTISPIPLEYLHFPVVAWGAIRLVAPGASVAILLTSGFAYWGFMHHLGPFWLYSHSHADPFVALQTYICMLVLTALATSATMAERERARTALIQEQERSEKLLLNILPQAIAQRLKLTNDTIADQFPAATVMFADLVDFTHLSAELSPQVLVALLNEIFSLFDALVEQYGLEKIKTIGDAYMVVGGIPEYREDHACAIAAMAIDMQRALTKFSEQHHRIFKMRIGINTGPVVAGVIGQKKFAYDLWGDTVNIASRMESTGMPGEIQVTRSTYEALKATYSFEQRGEIIVKGKGLMETFWLRSAEVAPCCP
jgi:class 3 adenylate cyclase/integral membrane sensor domain MASE1